MPTTWKFTNLLLEKQEIYLSCRLWPTVLAVGHTYIKRESACVARAWKWVVWFLNRRSHNHCVEFISKHVTPDWPPLTWPSIGFRQTGSAICFIKNQLRMSCRLLTYFSVPGIDYALVSDERTLLVRKPRLETDIPIDSGWMKHSRDSMWTFCFMAETSTAQNKQTVLMRSTNECDFRLCPFLHECMCCCQA